MDEKTWPIVDIAYSVPTVEGQFVKLTVATPEGNQVLEIKRDVFRNWQLFQKELHGLPGMPPIPRVSSEVDDKIAADWEMMAAEELRKLDQSN